MSGYVEFGKARKFLGFIESDFAFKLIERGYKIVDVDCIGGETVVTFRKVVR